LTPLHCASGSYKKGAATRLILDYDNPSPHVQNRHGLTPPHYSQLACFSPFVRDPSNALVPLLKLGADRGHTYRLMT
jgi:hypothetical protein